MAKNGFFSLRDCNQPAIRPCVDCRRQVCKDHLDPEGGSARCLDCSAKTGEQSEKAFDEGATSRSYDRSWAYRYRHRYYTGRDYHPIFWGHSYHHYYDDYDVRSFDRTDAGFEDDPDEKAGFGDS
ncbi:MAG TPA: hypothetical protein VM534_05270 [Thermoanaerobaculia bacterium]|nr:hypothetical protein [Thermoanaerobaculia bacterium]